MPVVRDAAVARMMAAGWPARKTLATDVDHWAWSDVPLALRLHPPLPPSVPMPGRPENIRTVDDLRMYVHHALCKQENLLADQFLTRECELRQNGAPCGLQFHLQGPRSVALSAIWTVQQNVVYFYDARGERFDKVQLPQRLNAEPAAASA